MTRRVFLAALALVSACVKRPRISQKSDDWTHTLFLTTAPVYPEPDNPLRMQFSSRWVRARVFSTQDTGGRITTLFALERDLELREFEGAELQLRDDRAWSRVFGEIKPCIIAPDLRVRLVRLSPTLTYRGRPFRYDQHAPLNRIDVFDAADVRWPAHDDVDVAVFRHV